MVGRTHFIRKKLSRGLGSKADVDELLLQSAFRWQQRQNEDLVRQFSAVSMHFSVLRLLSDEELLAIVVIFSSNSDTRALASAEYEGLTGLYHM